MSRIGWARGRRFILTACARGTVTAAVSVKACRGAASGQLRPGLWTLSCRSSVVGGIPSGIVLSSQVVVGSSLSGGGGFNWLSTFKSGADERGDAPTIVLSSSGSAVYFQGPPGDLVLWRQPALHRAAQPAASGCATATSRGSVLRLCRSEDARRYHTVLRRTSSQICLLPSPGVWSGDEFPPTRSLCSRPMWPQTIRPTPRSRILNAFIHEADAQSGKGRVFPHKCGVQTSDHRRRGRDRGQTSAVGDASASLDHATLLISNTVDTAAASVSRVHVCSAFKAV